MTEKLDVGFGEAMPNEDDNTLLIGAKKIAREISPEMTERQALHLLTTGQIKGAFKLGHQHAIRRGRLRQNWIDAERATLEENRA